ncbi:hypothetical protein TREMEDRAFT_66090 [Tremella mesenterica DSM 1558]|uniref:uncharacterized protein n=1 Tax=Tremella mesenterica (strain ATCC 24925 / CBS 8224 / DSM 1558 / NBRC 9311 / NRRL Y-6157 / RJB 2259-6 / UBC 559-6) TaxID=578456 RepID=UPI00032C0D6E|nr:uncharacterized protein TREMEDRAFT_66090 [Tremella mesenterica DSM 1558]EIW65996.1 hypothetical protein TREMEDRAFT_66090 [Tremella mesenterica DSM 1558]
MNKLKDKMSNVVNGSPYNAEKVRGKLQDLFESFPDLTRSDLGDESPLEHIQYEYKPHGSEQGVASSSNIVPAEDSTAPNLTAVTASVVSPNSIHPTAAEIRDHLTNQLKEYYATVANQQPRDELSALYPQKGSRKALKLLREIIQSEITVDSEGASERMSVYTYLGTEHVSKRFKECLASTLAYLQNNSPQQSISVGYVDTACTVMTTPDKEETFRRVIPYLICPTSMAKAMESYNQSSSTPKGVMTNPFDGISGLLGAPFKTSSRDPLAGRGYSRIDS